MDKPQYAVLLDGKLRAPHGGTGIRTYKTAERAAKENEFLKKQGRSVKIVEISFKETEEYGSN
jgi:hypothetical protein